MAERIQDLTGYQFTDFENSFESLGLDHSHTIRREPEVTYYDEFALEELLDIKQEYYTQFIEGWSRSFYSGEAHLKNILEYSIPDTPITAVNQSLYADSCSAVRMEINSLPRVEAFDVNTQLDLISYEPSSSAGYGYFGSKGPINGSVHKRAMSRAKATIYDACSSTGHGIEHQLRTAVPDVGYTRTQLADIAERTKVRGVWGRAFHYILLEGTSARPILEAFQNADSFYQIGSDPTVNVPRKLGLLSSTCRWMYGIDWSKFDATVSRFEINAAFDILKTMVIFPNFITQQAFEFSRQLFIHKKICAPDGHIYWAHKGIPSGSYYTSIVGSVVNRIRVEYMWRLQFNRGPDRCYTQGDDSLIGDRDYYNPEVMAYNVASLGWRLNPDKTVCSRIPSEVTFLGRTTTGGQNQRDIIRCLRLLILPEYPVTSGSISAFRARSIYEDSGGRSEILKTIADRLKRKFGIAEEEDVPNEFKRYVP